MFNFKSEPYRAVWFLTYIRSMYENDISISEVEKSTIRKLSFRILPFLILCYFISYIDRVNIGFAALTMNQEIGLTATAFGFGATLFLLHMSYLKFQVIWPWKS